MITKEVLLTKLNDMFGEDITDEQIKLLEDVADTFDSFSEGQDWKTKYEDNDKEWRKRYRERFEQPIEKPKDEEPEDPEIEVKTFEDLFTTA